MDDISETKSKNMKHKNNLNTRFIPSILMLCAGLVAFIICWFMDYTLTEALLVILITMFVFAIIGAGGIGVLTPINDRIVEIIHKQEEGLIPLSAKNINLFDDILAM